MEFHTAPSRILIALLINDFLTCKLSLGNPQVVIIKKLWQLVNTTEIDTGKVQQ